VEFHLSRVGVGPCAGNVDLFPATCGDTEFDRARVSGIPLCDEMLESLVAGLRSGIGWLGWNRSLTPEQLHGGANYLLGVAKAAKEAIVPPKNKKV